MAKSISRNLKADDYRRGALERLSDAFILLRADQFAGACSSAGRAVEGMLRAIIWKRDDDILKGRKSLETGHDLRELLTHVRNLGLLSHRELQNSEFESNVQHIGRLWFNNMRYVSSKFVESRWYNLGEVRKGRTLKQASEAFYFACASVVKRCEVLCRN